LDDYPGFARIWSGRSGCRWQAVATGRKASALDYLDKNENVFKVALEVTDETKVQTAVDAALSRFGQINLLVNNAASAKTTSA
jgi:NADP-dependent 3-hydroxy acid dehydrogenase YdfG